MTLGTKRRRLTEEQMRLLANSANDYLRRGVVGVHWELYEAVVVALREIEDRREDSKLLRHLAEAVRGFRNVDLLSTKFGIKLRGTRAYSKLCRAWEAYAGPRNMLG